jgi:hypothetical protein
VNFGIVGCGAYLLRSRLATYTCRDACRVNEEINSASFFSLARSDLTPGQPDARRQDHVADIYAIATGKKIRARRRVYDA